jgi:hypothetical protein
LNYRLEVISSRQYTAYHEQAGDDDKIYNSV